MAADVAGERIPFQLLHAQRNALALDIDRQNLGFNFLALLVIAHGFFAGLVPRKVGQVNQTVDTAGQADEDAEVGDRLDLALHFVALLAVHRELFPRIRHALLHAQRNAATVLVDLQHHDFDFVAELHDFRRVHVLVGPVHLGDVHQAFDARLDLDERAVVGEVRNLAEQAGVGRITARQAHPRIFAQLLHAQRDTVLFLIELQYFCGDFVANAEHLGRMLDATPCEIGDVQQTVDAAQIHERAVVGDVLDDALDRDAFAQVLEQLLAFFTLAGFKHGTA